MAQFVNTEINIGGTSIKQFSSFMLSQGIFDHHYFRLVCPAEAIDGTSGQILNKSKDMAGAAITIKVSAVESEGTLQFKGVVTQIEAARFSGHAGNVIISGYSPTILTDDGLNCKSWESKGIKNIAQDVLQQFPQNLLSSKINPVSSEPFLYTVQYKETAWQFLKRISANCGEWFFYDGEKLVLGSPKGNSANLVYGSNLSSFSMSLHVKPAKFEMMAYDYVNSAVYNGTPNGIEGKAGLNDLGKHTLQKSQQFYGSQPKQWHNSFLTSKKQLDDFVNTRAAMQSSNMVRFNGSSGHAGVNPGGTVKVQGKNVFNQSDESFGEYTVIAVHHHCDGQGNYTNDFVAIPASVKMPPVNMIPEPHCETQSAVVTDNHDVQGLGRVRVKFHWMDGAKSPWLRITSPHGGGDKGMFFIPETGEEVIVGFEGDSATKPYIIGTVYHSKAKTSFANAENDKKVIQTRSGHILEFNDKQGAESITVKDKNNNIITIDTPKGCIMIKDKANNHMTIDATNNRITVADKNNNNITIDAPSNNIAISANNDIKITAKGSITLAAMNINLVAGATVNVQATAAYNLNTMNSLSNIGMNTILKTGGLTQMVKNILSSTASTINQTAKKDINTKAKEKITISSKDKLDQRAGSMDVSTDNGRLRLKASSDLEIKGTTVKTN
jgi:type VI secretion system secreted protein VgrG